MSDVPRVSFIVLSYNYETYVSQTIRSILDQTYQDFEIVIVDDASRDRSCDVIEAFGDPRIRLIRNETNMGGAASYNRAVLAARGEWLANLDADDWIDARKTERQLEAVEGRPEIAIVGSFVHFVGSDGQPLSNTGLLDCEVNSRLDPNLLWNWIGRNSLCRSSTMVRRDVHLEVGLDDPSMVRAPDYELWTRFVRGGYRVLIVPERLVHYRVHTRNVTHGDPIASFTEICWILLRNIAPATVHLGAWPVFESAIRWIVTQARFADLSSRERERVIGLFFVDTRCSDYASYLKTIRQRNPDLELTGRLVMGLIFGHTPDSPVVSLQAMSELGFPASSSTAKLLNDIQLFVEARDYWMNRALAFEEAHRLKYEKGSQAMADFRLAAGDRAAKSLNGIRLFVKARDYWMKRAPSFEEPLQLQREKPFPIAPRLSRLARQIARRLIIKISNVRTKK